MMRIIVEITMRMQPMSDLILICYPSIAIPTAMLVTGSKAPSIADFALPMN